MKPISILREIANAEKYGESIIRPDKAFDNKYDDVIKSLCDAYNSIVFGSTNDASYSLNYANDILSKLDSNSQVAKQINALCKKLDTNSGWNSFWNDPYSVADRIEEFARRVEKLAAKSSAPHDIEYSDDENTENNETSEDELGLSLNVSPFSLDNLDYYYRDLEDALESCKSNDDLIYVLNHQKELKKDMSKITKMVNPDEEFSVNLDNVLERVNDLRDADIMDVQKKEKEHFTNDLVPVYKQCIKKNFGVTPSFDGSNLEFNLNDVEFQIHMDTPSSRVNVIPNNAEMFHFYVTGEDQLVEKISKIVSEKTGDYSGEGKLSVSVIVNKFLNAFSELGVDAVRGSGMDNSSIVINVSPLFKIKVWSGKLDTPGDFIIAPYSSKTWDYVLEHADKDIGLEKVSVSNGYFPYGYKVNYNDIHKICSYVSDKINERESVSKDETN